MSEKVRFANLVARHERLRKALEEIANGDGVYGMQAFEYKEIARQALKRDDQ